MVDKFRVWAIMNRKNFLIFLLIFLLLFFLIFLLFKSNFYNNFNNKINFSNVNDSLINKDNQFKDINKNCREIPILENNAVKLVTKVIDGDTFLIEGGYSVRVLGIDADERGYSCFDEAKNKLEELILNKKVKLIKDNRDLDNYCRYLRYVFIGDKNVSEELVKIGAAVSRFSSEDTKYRNEVFKAEKFARENKIGCKWRSDAKQDEIKYNLKWENLTFENTGLKIIDACQSKYYYDQKVIVEGLIVDTYRSKTDTVFLNFGAPYPKNCFVAVIFKSDQNKFIDKPEIYFKNKIVRIMGKIKEYQGRPEIILKDSSQIEVGKVKDE